MGGEIAADEKEQFINGTSAHYRLSSATELEVIESRQGYQTTIKRKCKNQSYRGDIKQNRGG